MARRVTLNVIATNGRKRKGAKTNDNKGEIKESQPNTSTLNSGAYFHVTPHCVWFSNYARGQHVVVHLGDNYAYDIVGIVIVQLEFQYGFVFFFFLERFSSIVLKYQESTSKNYMPVGLQCNVCTPKLCTYKTAYIRLLNL
mgnify:CR=1 FL=1